MPYIEWTNDMGEISGFGGSYEAGCRAMVRAGVEYWEAQDAAFERGERSTKFDPHYRGIKNVMGLAMDDNDDARALDEAMMSAEVEGKTVREWGPTGAMHHAAVNHILAFRRLGADEYVRTLRARDKDEAAGASAGGA
jgi:hypothetical protein